MRIVVAVHPYGFVALPAIAAALTAGSAPAQPADVAPPPVTTWTISVAAGGIERSNLPLHGRLPSSVAAHGVAPGQAVKLTLPDGSRIDGQILPAGLPAAASPKARDIVFVLPKLEAQATVEIEAEMVAPAEATIAAEAAAHGREYRLRWAEDGGGFTLLQAGKPLIRYEMPVYDASSEEARVKTYKPFHQVFDPVTGIRLTKGDGGLYTHHRGIFFGYGTIAHGPDLATGSDCWHCTGAARQEHTEILAQTAGPVAALQRVAIAWIGSDGKPILDEVREIEAMPVRNGTVIDFASRLAADSPVRLDGDPQHAGVHFRASNEVAEATRGETYYVRPDGKAEPGRFRNWPQDRSAVNLPWHAASFVVGGQRYTVLRVNRPANPGESWMSERDYARFGSYFEHELTPGRPLLVGYRFWVQAGELTADEAARIAADYASPATVTVLTTNNDGERRR